jgi:hypothetical protein
MRPPVPAVAAALLLASPARAQLSNHLVTAESGVATALAARGVASTPVAVSAGAWLDGDVDVVARVAWAASARTGGRGAASTLGLRWSLLAAPVRPQLHAEAGWAWGLDGRRRHAAVIAAGAGVEAFVARDVSLGVRASVRALLRRGAGAGAAFTGGASFYF